MTNSIESYFGPARLWLLAGAFGAITAAAVFVLVALNNLDTLGGSISFSLKGALVSLAVAGLFVLACSAEVTLRWIRKTQAHAVEDQ